MEPFIILIYVLIAFLVQGYEVGQPIDEIDIILRQHDIIEVLAVLGDIEAQAEFFPDIATDSPFEE